MDPYAFFPDPDPEFEAGDQYGSGIQSGSRALMTKNWRKKITTEIFILFFLIKNCNLPIPWPP